MYDTSVNTFLSMVLEYAIPAMGFEAYYIRQVARYSFPEWRMVHMGQERNRNGKQQVSLSSIHEIRGASLCGKS
jgi:hypothetical protein